MILSGILIYPKAGHAFEKKFYVATQTNRQKKYKVESRKIKKPEIKIEKGDGKRRDRFRLSGCGMRGDR